MLDVTLERTRRLRVPTSRTNDTEGIDPRAHCFFGSTREPHMLMFSNTMYYIFNLLKVKLRFPAPTSGFAKTVGLFESATPSSDTQEDGP